MRHTLQASDLQKRPKTSVDSLEDLDREVRALVSTDFTAVVVNGFDNLCPVLHLLNQFSYEILGVNGIIHHLQLTNAGCLHIARKARRYSTFEIGIKDLVIAALDLHYMHFIGLRSTGARSTNGDAERIERIFCGFRYLIDRDAEHIEWSIALGVLDAFLKCPTAQKLGIRALQWRKRETEPETRWLRVPFLFAYGGMCCGLKNLAQKTDAEVLQAFSEKMVEFAQQNGQSTREPTQPLLTPARLHEDCTFETGKETTDGRVASSMRTGSHFDQLPFVISAGPLKLKLRNAVIVAARIIAEAKLGDEHYVFPEQANIVVANQHGRPLAVDNGEKRDNKFVTSGSEIFSTDPVQPERIRWLLLQYMGTDNVLVGFHLNWLLTAVELLVPATRVIDLGFEPAFQNYVKALDASAGGVYEGFFHLHQRVAFDRPQPAYLMNIGLYVEKKDDLIYEAYYTAALWQVVIQQVLNGRGRIDTDRVEPIYVVYQGEDPHDEECRLLQQKVDLYCLDTCNGDSVFLKELAVKDKAKLMSQCKISGIEVRPADDKARQQKTRLECLELLDTRELASATSAYSEEFETARPLVRAATNIALAQLRMPDETKLMVP